MAQIIVQNPQALLLLPLVWFLLLAFAWRRRFRPFGPFLLRLIIVVLITLALAQPALPSSATSEVQHQDPLVLLVDQSASVGSAGRQILRDMATQVDTTRDDVTTVYFAKQALLVKDPAFGSPSIEGEVALDAEATNIAEALTLGAELLNEQPGRLVLLSDGVPTTGRTLEAAGALAQQDIPVDVLTPGQADLQSWREGQNDVQVAQLSIPSALRSGETFDVAVVIYSENPTEATLNLIQNDETLAEDVVMLEAGLNRYTFAATAGTVGSQTFRATVAAGDDRHPENDSFSAFAEVYPPPDILIVGSEPQESNRFATVLTSAGYQTQVVFPGDVPDRLSELERFEGMVLLNVSARSFELEQMLAIQEYVRSLGRGLVVTGGRDSLSLGAYEGTPLEELLPLSLEPPPREERPPVALLLIIDHSGSMIENRGSTATRLAMAKEAAIRATDILGPDDLLGVLMFDNQFEWVIPFQQIEDGAELLEIQQRVARIPAGGGTRILQALEVALPELIAQETARTRHAVLLTDGKSFDGQQGLDDYYNIVDQAVDADITLSTIAIGSGADVILLEDLAERGRGRYHFAEFPEELPALTVSESDILRSNALQEGDFGIGIYEPHPILRGLFAPLPTSGQAGAPNLAGYLAMSPKPRSEVALQVGPGDPLLSVWGYGLGRVVTWSSDVGAEWAAAWPNWPEFSRFWGQVVGYTVPAPDLALLQLDTVEAPDNTIVFIADAVSTTGQPIDRARTQAVLRTPGGGEEQFLLRQVAPGRYEQRVHIPDPGAYELSVTQSRSDAEDESATTGFIVSYPAEYGFPADDTGLVLLEQIARITGGRTFSLDGLSQIGLSETGPDEISEEDLIHLWPWLLGAALILWPLEIAWRRWGRLRIQ